MHDSPNIFELTNRCKEETAKDKQKLPHDPTPCLNLLRCVINTRSSEAWSSFQDCFIGLIKAAINKLITEPDTREDMVQDMYLKLANISVEKAEELKFQDLKAFRAYVTRIAKNVCFDELRRREREKRSLPLVYQQMEETAYDHDDALDMETLKKYIRAKLKDAQEELLFKLMFEFDLKPREIVAQHGHIFPDIATVERVRERIIKRLKRDPRLQYLLSD